MHWLAQSPSMGIPGFTGGQVPGFSATGRAQHETQQLQQGQGWALQLPEPRARPRPCLLAPAAGGPQHGLRALPARSSAPRCCCQPGTPGDAQSHPPVWRAPRSALSLGAHGWHRTWSHGTGPRRCLSPTVPCFCHREPQPGSRGARVPRAACTMWGSCRAAPCPLLPAAGSQLRTALSCAAARLSQLRPCRRRWRCHSPWFTSEPSHHITSSSSSSSHHITSHCHHAPAPVSVCPGCSRAR